MRKLLYKMKEPVLKKKQKWPDFAEWPRYGPENFGINLYILGVPSVLILYDSVHLEVSSGLPTSVQPLEVGILKFYTE